MFDVDASQEGSLACAGEERTAIDCWCREVDVDASGEGSLLWVDEGEAAVGCPFWDACCRVERGFLAERKCEGRLDWLLEVEFWEELGSWPGVSFCEGRAVPFSFRALGMTMAW